MSFDYGSSELYSVEKSLNVFDGGLTKQGIKKPIKKYIYVAEFSWFVPLFY